MGAQKKTAHRHFSLNLSFPHWVTHTVTQSPYVQEVAVAAECIVCHYSIKFQFLHFSRDKSVLAIRSYVFHKRVNSLEMEMRNKVQVLTFFCKSNERFSSTEKPWHENIYALFVCFSSQKLFFLHLVDFASWSPRFTFLLLQLLVPI